MGRKIILWTVFTFCIALVLTVWPVAHRLTEAREDARQVEIIQGRVASLGEGQLAKYRDLAKWYNHQLELGGKGLRGAYNRILDLGEGSMGVLEVPESGLRLAISHGYTGEVGHDPESPLPIGGRGNHTVLILTESYFWRTGQAVYIDILGKRLCYRVESVQVMPLGWSTEQPCDGAQDLLTLVHDRGNTRTIIRCVRCADLTVRQQDERNPGRLIPAAILLLGAFGWGRKFAKCEQMPRICGFYRENPEKSNLF